MLNILSKFKKINPEVKCIIDKLKTGELEVRGVPVEFSLDPNVIQAERTLGIRKSGRRGFDVINQSFFVEEVWIYKDLSGDLRPTMHRETFDSFAEYYKFLDGDIYENACYYQYPFTDEFSSKLKVDITQLRRTKSFETRSVDDYSYEISTDEIAEYDHCEKTNKKLVKQWISKFNACDTYDQFKCVCNNYEKSAIAQCKSMEFFFFQYAFDDLQNKEHLGVIMEYLSKDYIGGTNVVFGLCMIYAPEEILDKYDFSQASDITNKKRKRELKNFVESLNAQDVKVQKRGYFDKKTHFYCEETELYSYVNIQGRRTLSRWPSVHMCRAFETFDEFIAYKKGDLKNCDISGAFDLNVDFSKYTTDITTTLPITKSEKIKYEVRKMYSKGKFAVGQFWYDEYDKCVKQQIHNFRYFFDFVAFLKGDLSGADLVFCTGLKNLSNVDGINLNGARITSDVCEQFKIPFTTYEYEKKLIAEFPIVEKNEIETSFVLQMRRETESLASNFGGEINRISYISDLHLMHRIKNAECKSKEDVICVIQKIVDTILDESNRITLIGGDVASDFSIFKLFVKLLRRSADIGQSGYEQIFGKKIFIFILGNHELWNFPGVPLEEIVNQYRTILMQNEMFLLHNDLFYCNESDDMGIIPYNELIQSQNLVISEKLRCARLVILGGLGFSGYNKELKLRT